MSQSPSNRPIINLAEAPAHSGGSGEHFSHTVSPLASVIGARAIGANVTRVPPGKAAFPLHHHFANEEHFFVLSGTGVLRVGDAVHPVKRHDYIVNLPGGAELAHQLINTGNEDLVYLSISTQVLPEVVGYPDSAKTGVRTAREGAAARFIIDDAARDALQYWEREEGSAVAAIVAGTVV